MISLKNKVVIITGASSGIGKAAAIAFAKNKAIVILAARRKERIEQLASELSKYTTSLAVQTDVTDESQIQNLITTTLSKFQKIDILINNAGTGLKAPLPDITQKDFTNLLQTNLMSVFLCTKAATEAMKKTNSKGHIITISSLAGLFGASNYAAYCASKHAVTGFKKSIKGELKKHNIKVTTIHPARIQTEFFDNYKQPPGRGQMLTAKDMADYIIAVAQRSKIKTIFIRTLNVAKRLYYLLKYSI
jgi:NADP-dependent 3-hydroxy acid dehydrogenase YdfG